MALEIRTITAGEVAAFRDGMLQTFGLAPEVDPGFAERFIELIDLSQAWAAFDAGTLVATAATFALEIGLPGGASLPIAGLTAVTVRPTHRRRGILRQLVQRHLDDARARGYAVSGLWASEAGIYGRFGYGLATLADAIEIEHAHDLTVAAGRELDVLEPIDEARARELLSAIYERATAGRPGALRRTDVWWRERRFLETPWARGGASPRRHVVARRGDELVGYLVYRQRPGFTRGLPSGTVDIVELLAVDPRAEATLWQFALHVDLFPNVTWANAPVDDSLTWIVSDPRRIRRRRTDALFLRIDDVPAALSARGYDHDGVLVLALDGQSWELAAERGRGRCVPTTRAPDLRLDRRTLGALYLGGTPASQLARAGLVEGTARALATADRLFASPLAPWCPEVF